MLGSKDWRWVRLGYGGLAAADERCGDLGICIEFANDIDVTRNPCGPERNQGTNNSQIPERIGFLVLQIIPGIGKHNILYMYSIRNETSDILHVCIMDRRMRL